jgi:hypothetical protein
MQTHYLFAAAQVRATERLLPQGPDLRTHLRVPGGHAGSYAPTGLQVLCTEEGDASRRPSQHFLLRRDEVVEETRMCAWQVRSTPAWTQLQA